MLVSDPFTSPATAFVFEEVVVVDSKLFKNEMIYSSPHVFHVLVIKLLLNDDGGGADDWWANCKLYRYINT